MARPSKFDRDEAVETVMNEIWRNGYKASSVKALSDRLGITRSSFYNAFGSREALFREALKRYFAQTPDRPLGEATPKTPIRQLFTSVFRAICRARAMNPAGRGCMAINSVAELCPGHEELGALLAQAVLGSAARIEQLIHWGIEQDEIDAGTNAHALALAVQNLMVGLNVICKVIQDEDELWAAASTTLKGLGLYEENTGARV